MATVDPHPELVGLPNEQALRDLFDLFNTNGYDTPEPPTHDCVCEWGQYRYRNAGVAILDDHRECPFCRGYIGGKTTDD